MRMASTSSCLISCCDGCAMVKLRYSRHARSPALHSAERNQALALPESLRQAGDGLRVGGMASVQELRLHHHRRRLGRLRAGQPADRGPRHQGAGARGRRLGPRPVDPHPARLGQDPHQPPARLDVLHRARAEPGRPADRMRARQGDRRLVVDQRHDLFARPPRRLRPLGARTACRRGPMPTRCRISRSRRPGRTAPSAHRGGDGPLGTCWSTFHDPLADAYTAASKAAGLKWNADLNSGDNEGIGRNQNTIRNGRRCSAAVAYLRPAMARDQSHGRDRRAGVARSCSRAAAPSASNTGSGGEHQRCARRREVLLAGGVINSPQVLMLSGIGDPDALRAAGIKPQVALPRRRAESAGPRHRDDRVRAQAAGRHGAQVDAARPHRDRAGRHVSPGRHRRRERHSRRHGVVRAR